MTSTMRDVVKAGYEAGDYSGEFRANPEPDEHARYFLQKLLVLSPSSPTILDLGCGTGIPFDRFLVSEGAKLTGIDFSRKHIALAKRNVPLADYIEADFSRVELGLDRFDCVVAFYAIFHLPRDEHRALFEKIARTLRGDGLFLATLGAVASAYGEDANWTGAKMAWSSHDPDTYCNLLQQAGFAIVDSGFEGKLGDQEHHWWMMARKIASFAKA
jgi:SAM-dependent methyltransferase